MADDTTALQSWIDGIPDGGMGILPSGTYLVGGDLSIANRSGLTIMGQPGAVLQYSGSSMLAAHGLRIAGSSSNVTIRGLHFLGDGTTANNHYGIWTGSSSPIPYLESITIEDCKFEDLVVGITIDQSTAGSIENPVFHRNKIRNMVGTNSGQGYGINLASSQTGSIRGKILFNDIDQCQRHSIYVARGRGSEVVGNTITRHRDGTTDGAVRGAIVIARSQDISVIGNTLSECNNACLEVTSDDASYPAKNVKFVGNSILNIITSSFEIPPIMIGTATTDSGSISGISVIGNTVTMDNSQTGIQALRLVRGVDVMIANNTFTYVTTSANVNGIISINGEQTYGNGTSGVHIENNMFYGIGGIYNMSGIRVNPDIATATSMSVSFRSNRFTLESSGTANTFSVPTTITNNAISLFDHDDTGLTRSVATANIRLGSTELCYGSGDPEGAVVAHIGSIYLRTDGGTSTSFYVKETGTGDTGWVAK